ncbi:MAG: hypothetical protein EBZ77_01630 [Chitinophagia bacterium]|nr:hypothetical protein [Chitinophagia bacterium]
MKQILKISLCLLLLALPACKTKKDDVTPVPTPISLSNYCLYHLSVPTLTIPDTFKQCEIYLNQPYQGNASIMAFNAVGSEIAYPFLRFTFKKFNGVGSYIITDTGNCNAYFYYTLSHSVAGIAGTLNITDSMPYRGNFQVCYSDSTSYSGWEFKCKP